MSKRLQITAQQLRDLIREVEFHEKRMQTVITLWGEKNRLGSNARQDALVETPLECHR
jgi:hypothetical protein